jgi:hypothetical protein
LKNLGNLSSIETKNTRVMIIAAALLGFPWLSKRYEIDDESNPLKSDCLNVRFEVANQIETPTRK